MRKIGAALILLFILFSVNAQDANYWSTSYGAGGFFFLEQPLLKTVIAVYYFIILLYWLLIQKTLQISVEAFIISINLISKMVQVKA